MVIIELKEAEISKVGGGICRCSSDVAESYAKLSSWLGTIVGVSVGYFAMTLPLTANRYLIKGATAVVSCFSVLGFAKAFSDIGRMYGSGLGNNPTGYVKEMTESDGSSKKEQKEL